MNSLRILTLWQPWASLVALGYKQYETRSWNGWYGGDILIHAAKRKINPLEFDAACQLLSEVDRSTILQHANATLGCVVAIAQVNDCVRMVAADQVSDWEIRINEVSELERSVGIWEEDRYAWPFENVRELPSPIPFKGAQGLRKSPPQLSTLVKQQLVQVGLVGGRNEAS